MVSTPLPPLYPSYSAARRSKHPPHLMFVYIVTHAKLSGLEGETWRWKPNKNVGRIYSRPPLQRGCSLNLSSRPPLQRTLIKEVVS